jgi:hypothetical protein
MNRKRDKHIQFWLNQAELNDFERRVKRSGLSRENYIRQMIKGLQPQDAPTADYFKMAGELRNVATALDALLAYANPDGFNEDDSTYAKLCSTLADAECTIANLNLAVIEPRKIKL